MVFEFGVGLIQNNGLFNVIFTIILVSRVNRLEQEPASLLPAYMKSLFEPADSFFWGKLCLLVVMLLGFIFFLTIHRYADRLDGHDG